MLNDYCDEMGRYLNLDLIRDLVSFSSSLGTQTDQVLSLVRRNARTLQRLDLDIYHATDISGLLQDLDSGKHVEYPHLHTLKLGSTPKYQSLHAMTITRAILFPCLRQLQVKPYYPFGDDVLFRGNAATLESMKLALHQETVDILRKYNVFRPTSHPRLQCVSLFPTQRRVAKDFAQAGSYLEFVLSIAPGAAVRQITDVSVYEQDIAPALHTFGNYACIQVLLFPHTSLTIWDVIALVRSLPLLSELRTGLPKLGESIPGVSTTDLPEYVCSNYAPLGSRFR
ncbi:hypothetical protein LPJ60_005919, partial [Coemansia sp. RSA 2675]